MTTIALISLATIVLTQQLYTCVFVRLSNTKSMEHQQQSRRQLQTHHKHQKPKKPNRPSAMPVTPHDRSANTSAVTFSATLVSPLAFHNRQHIMVYRNPFLGRSQFPDVYEVKDKHNFVRKQVETRILEYLERQFGAYIDEMNARDPKGFLHVTGSMSIVGSMHLEGWDWFVRGKQQLGQEEWQVVQHHPYADVDEVSEKDGDDCKDSVADSWRTEEQSTLQCLQPDQR